MIRLTSLLCTALLVLPLHVFAQDEGRETPPVGGTPKDFTLPLTQSFSLENEMEATLVPFGNVPKASVVVMVRSGGLNAVEQTWLAELSADLLLEGTTSRSGADIAQEAAGMGGEVSIDVGPDQTRISADVLSEFVPGMIALLADIIRAPAFPESELERLKRDRLRQLSIATSQPQQMARAAFHEALYGDHPYGRLFPQEEQLNGYTIDAARRFHQQNFGARRSHIYVAGVFDASATRDAIAAAFDDWEPGPEPVIDVPEPAAGKVATDVIDRPGASQSNLLLGLPTISPEHEDWIALQITNALLGGSFASRITSNIREDKGYTYSPGSGISARYRDAYWAQSAAVTTSVTGPALKEIYYEIDRLQETPPTNEELDGIKNYVAGLFVLQNATRGGIIGILNSLDLHDIPESYLADYVGNVYAVSPERVSEIAATRLRDEDMTLVIVGDRAQISEQVAPYLELRD